MPKITIKVDKDMCIGAAACVAVSPDTFRMNEENKAVVMDHGQDGNLYEREVEVTDEELANIILGAESCPTLAISILDEDGNKIFPK